MSNIGIMGGTFDPIHNGHLMIGRQAYEEYGLDQIWYMPSGRPPHKTDHKVTDINDRCEMTKLAIRPYPYFAFSDFEVRLGGNSYTARTLELLKKGHRHDTFFFIIGADSLYQIETWYHPELVMKQTTLLVAGREYADSHLTIDEQIQYLTAVYDARILRLHCAEMDISSAQLRAMVREGREVSCYLPPEVDSYIKIHSLYSAVSKAEGEVEDGQPYTCHTRKIKR